MILTAIIEIIPVNFIGRLENTNMIAINTMNTALPKCVYNKIASIRSLYINRVKLF